METQLKKEEIIIKALGDEKSQLEQMRALVVEHIVSVRSFALSEKQKTEKMLYESLALQSKYIGKRKAHELLSFIHAFGDITDSLIKTLEEMRIETQNCGLFTIAETKGKAKK